MVLSHVLKWKLNDISDIDEIVKTFDKSKNYQNVKVYIYVHDPERAGYYSPLHHVYLFDKRKITSGSLVVVDENILKRSGFKRFNMKNIKAIPNVEKYHVYIKLVCDNESIAENEEYFELVKVSFIEHLQAKRCQMRNTIIHIAFGSKDLNSFLYKVINNIFVKKFGCEAASAYVASAYAKQLTLRASTDLESNEDGGNYTRHEAYFDFQDTNSNTMVCYDGGQCILRYRDGASLNQTKYPEKVEGIHYSRLYLPLRITANIDAELKEEYDIDSNKEIYQSPIGVIRAVNPGMPHKDKILKRHFTWCDKFFMRLVADVVTALSHRYVNMRQMQEDIEHVFHGTLTQLTAIERSNELIQLCLRGNDDLKWIPLVDPARYNSAPWFRVNNASKDITAFIDYMNFQIKRIREISAEQNYLDDYVEKPFIDIFMKINDMKDAFARVLGKKAVVMNSLKEAELIKIPPIVGNKDAWLTVFKNLLENSIKYCGEGQEGSKPVVFVDITKEVTDESVIITFADQGIGIAREDKSRIFHEGYRGVQGRRASNRGSGYGLTHSLRLAKACGGDIELEESDKSDRGCAMKVTMRRYDE